MFFSFDGIDGAGKSTQIERFCAWLTAEGHDVFACRDPGSTPAGEQIRHLLLDHQQWPIGRRCEMLLYMAARAQLVEEQIVPALDAGRVVVCDRFLLANVVYQGYGGGLDVESLWQIGHYATAGVSPDLTFLLDLDPQVAAGRIARTLDRMEQQGDDFRTRIREGFLREARRRPEAIVVIDAARPADTVQAEIRAVAAPLLPARGAGKSAESR